MAVLTLSPVSLRLLAAGRKLTIAAFCAILLLLYTQSNKTIPEAPPEPLQHISSIDTSNQLFETVTFEGYFNHETISGSNCSQIKAHNQELQVSKRSFLYYEIFDIVSGLTSPMISYNTLPEELTLQEKVSTTWERRPKQVYGYRNSKCSLQ